MHGSLSCAACFQTAPLGSTNPPKTPPAQRSYATGSDPVERFEPVGTNLLSVDSFFSSSGRRAAILVPNIETVDAATGHRASPDMLTVDFHGN